MIAIAGVLMLLGDGWFVYVHGATGLGGFIAASVAALFGGLTLGFGLGSAIR